MLPLDTAKALGKAIDEKARKVLDCEHAIRPVVEMIPPYLLRSYGLEPWTCRYCHRPFKYSLILGRWACKCDGMTIYGKVAI